VVHYGDGEFVLLKPGRNVLCAVTGEKIPLEALRYWNPTLQEAYAGPAEAWRAGKNSTAERRALLARSRRLGPVGFPAAAAARPAPSAAAIQQGGFVLGRTSPRAQVTVDGRTWAEASAHGLFVVGYDRDAAAQVHHHRPRPTADGQPHRALAPTDLRHPAHRRPAAGHGDPTAPALLANASRPRRPARPSASPAARTTTPSRPASSCRRPPCGSRAGSAASASSTARHRPRTTARTSPARREPRSSPPPPGRCRFAESDMHYEGGLTMIDHGQGLISLYLHQSPGRREAGRRVAAGSADRPGGHEGPRHRPAPVLAAEVAWAPRGAAADAGRPGRHRHRLTSR
jgi:hypothetical protein